jgi:hypothetical protein
LIKYCFGLGLCLFRVIEEFKGWVGECIDFFLCLSVPNEVGICSS